ncbi:4-carboxy-4-hydroxy-2-oxoadipate aldolase/oxaloacetate decarboxylase [Salipiger sp.]|uniref:4-carboxy-4-hydroxy-2-oxoadipate aldolase/oxaloacetate decarboxylase n=1 Tax=Salipiger sp. TaxID=2078585 RepID=UPI003A987F84
MTPVAYTRIPRIDKALIARAARISVADLHEGLGAVAGRQCLMSVQMRPMHRGRPVCGQAVTCYNFPGDNLMLHVAARLAEAGDVLVVTNGGTPHGALWGDVMTHFCQTRGIAGAVIDGAARDTDRIAEMGFPVYSTHISVSHPEKRGPGSANVPVVVAGVTVNPGDLIVADSDGVMAIPPHLLEAAVANAEAREAKETAIRKRIDGGETIYDIMGLQAEVDASGMVEIEGTWQDAQG